LRRIRAIAIALRPLFLRTIVVVIGAELGDMTDTVKQLALSLEKYHFATVEDPMNFCAQTLHPLMDCAEQKRAPARAGATP